MPLFSIPPALRTAAAFLVVALGFTAGSVFASSADPHVAIGLLGGREGIVIKDEFSYLEKANDQRVQAWVTAENARTLSVLKGDRRYHEYYQMALSGEVAATSSAGSEHLPSTSRLTQHRGWVYQLWADETHPRSVWRRAALSSFLTHKPEWQPLIDISAYADSQHANLMFVEALISPNGRRALVEFTSGDGMTVAWHEFDLEERKFVVDGFRVPLSNSTVVWRDNDTVLIATNLEGGDSVSRSGQPMIIKEWSRGKALAQAKEIFRGGSDDYEVALAIGHNDYGGMEEDNEGRREVHFGGRDADFVPHMWRLDRNHTLERLADPMSHFKNTQPFKGHYITVLEEDWQTGGRTWPKGSVVSIPTSDIVRAHPRVYGVLAPGKYTSVYGVAKARSGIVLYGSWLNYSRLWRARFEDGSWTTDSVALPEYGVAVPEAFDIRSDVAFIRYQDPLCPPSLYGLDVDSNELTLLARTKPQFDSNGFVAEQGEAKSVDGVMVPYLLIRPRNFLFDGQTSALITSYGAQSGSSFPFYLGALGKLWLERGGVHVIANVRGGAEKGPQWAVQGVGRQHTYEDAIAVTEELIRRRVTSPKRIGFMGYSNGGLLGGVLLNLRPDLFGAMVLKAPVLDQIRVDFSGYGPYAFKKEYGSLDVPHERAFLERTSPFQNLRARAEYPPPFLITSATDERVLPAQVRRYAAKMTSLGMSYYFYETPEGGHGLAVTADQRAQLEALTYTYFARQLLDPRL